MRQRKRWLGRQARRQLWHELHRFGIPLVVASQFPLDWEASTHLTETLYSDFLWGRNPLVGLYKLRSDLHSMFRSTHDWASLVIYESLPDDLDAELEELRYRQAKLAVEAALGEADREIATGKTLDLARRKQLFKRVDVANSHLPRCGRFTIEALGLMGSSAKRRAQAEFNAGRELQARERYDRLRSCYDLLDQACNDYEQAARIPNGPDHWRLSSLHWVLTQMLSLGKVIGRKYALRNWENAVRAAEFCLGHHDTSQQLWAHGSLAELYLLRLVKDFSHLPVEPSDLEPEFYGDEPTSFGDSASHHANQLIELARGRDPFFIQSTLRQFHRYCDWWGHPDFTAWLQRYRGVSASRLELLVATARDITEKLEREVRIREYSDEDDGRNGNHGDEPGSDGPGKDRPGGDQPQGPQLITPARDAPSKSPPHVLRSGPESAKGGPAGSAGPVEGKATEASLFSVEMLPARNGDCLWIEYGDAATPSRILIDCGAQSAYSILRDRIDALPPNQREFELFVLTHIDFDHISGAIPFFNDRDLDVGFGDVWFNGWKHLQLGAKQGETFSTLLADRGLNWNVSNRGGPIAVRAGRLPAFDLPGGMRITLLSPTSEKLRKLRTVWMKELKKHGLTPGATHEYRRFLRGGKPTTSEDVDALADTPFKGDRGAANGSSIAFLAEFGGHSVLFAADAHSPLLVESVKQLLRERNQQSLRIDALKLSHHGSHKSLNVPLLKLLTCKRYLVSSDGSHFNHPDREAIARVIKYGGDRPSLYFNYLSEENKIWGREDLQQKYGYQANYPVEGKEGMKIPLG